MWSQADRQAFRSCRLTSAGGRYCRVEYQVLLQQRPDGVWRAKIPLLPGCVAEARSRDGALDEIRAAARMYVEGLLEERIADEGEDSTEEPVEELTITV